MSRRLGIIGLLAAALFICGDLLALDTHFKNRTAADGYTVRTRQGTSLDRRNLFEEIQLDTWNLWPGTGGIYDEGPWVSMAADLRLDTDLGVGAEERNPSLPRHYVAGVDLVDFDAMYAYVDANGLWENRLGLRAGRQILVDPCGWVAFDGGQATLRGGYGIELRVYSGLEVLGADTLGYDNFELDGVESGSRKGLDSNQYPDRKPPSSVPVVGVGLHFAPYEWFRGDLAYRVHHPGDRVQSDRIAAGIEPSIGPVSLFGSAAYDILLEQWSIVDAELDYDITHAFTVYVDGTREKPVFLGDSIFNVFATDPRNDVGAGARLDVGSEVSLAAHGLVRLADDGYGIQGNGKDEIVSGIGGSLSGAAGVPGERLGVTFSTLAGYGDRYSGIEVTGEKSFLFEALLVEARASIWQTRDSTRVSRGGLSGGYVAGVRYRLVQGAYLWAEFAHTMNEVDNQNIEVLAMLDLDLWW